MDVASEHETTRRGSWMDWLAYLGLRTIVCLIQSLSRVMRPHLPDAGGCA